MSQTAHTFASDVTIRASLRYLLHLPADHHADAAWPVVLFLHGMGERGDEVGRVAAHGLARRLGEGLDLPAIVVSPQCPEGEIWSQHLAAVYPDRFAALAPVCAGMTTFLDPARIAHLPMWAFHGEDDPVVPVAASHDLVARHRDAGGEARLTLYPGVRHDAWGPAYETAELYDWLLAQRRRS